MWGKLKRCACARWSKKLSVTLVLSGELDQNSSKQLCKAFGMIPKMSYTLKAMLPDTEIVCKLLTSD